MAGTQTHMFHNDAGIYEASWEPYQLIDHRCFTVIEGAEVPTEKSQFNDWFGTLRFHDGKFKDELVFAPHSLPPINGGV